MTDLNAVDFADIQVKIRFNGVKIPRTPYNITSAIEALLIELNGLEGLDGLGRVFKLVIATASDNETVGNQGPFKHSDFIAKGVEMLVNDYGYIQHPTEEYPEPRATAKMIKQELKDMALLG
jgi:hypothetical protein